MTSPADTCPLTDAEILHLLRTLTPGIPPGLNHPPLPPATLTSPPWVARPQTARLGRWIALSGALGLLILWGIAHTANGSAPPAGLAPYATLAPGVVYLAGAPTTATPAPTVAPPATATATPLPTAPPTLPPVVPTVAPPTLAPPTATPVRVRVPPAYQPRSRPPAPPMLPSPTAPLPLPPPTTAPLTPAGGSGAWGNDWSGAIFDRSATIRAPTPSPGSGP